MAKTPNKISMQHDLRDVRGGSIPSSKVILNKKDKANTRRELNKKVRNWRDEIDESNDESDLNIPDKFYHATYKPLMNSIKKFGLGGKSSGYEWEDSKLGVVYLATDEDVAISYAEANDFVPEEWLDEIVILEIDSSGLDEGKLVSDSNVIDNDGSTYEYHGVISPRYLSTINIIDEAEDAEDLDRMLWEVFDYLQDNLLRDKNIVSTYCAEEFPPTLKVITTDKESFELPIEVLDDRYSALDAGRFMYGKTEDQQLATVLNVVRKCIKEWDYSSDVRSLNDSNFGPGIYFENDYGVKIFIGITHMV